MKVNKLYAWKTYSERNKNVSMEVSIFLCNWSTLKVDPYIANTYITLMCKHKLKDLFCYVKNWSHSVVQHYNPTSTISFNNFKVTFMSLHMKYINILKS